MFWIQGIAVSRAGFAASVEALAGRLPTARYAINVCENRFAFCTAFAAVVARGQTNLLPGNSNPATLEELARRYPDSYVLWDDSVREGVLVPRIPNGDRLTRLDEVPARHPAALVFTSGSTGAPQAHLKTWHSLQHSGVTISGRLLPGASSTIVATVPQQHMYGLETSVAVPLAAHHAISTDRPVFPEDVRRALLVVPSPRILVTTPVHIRAMLAAGTELPDLAGVVSATAPLPQELAARAEAYFRTPIREIYGSTETGSVASRRTVEGPRWQLLDGVELQTDAFGSRVSAGHLDGTVELHDVLEPEADGFRLIGRTGDILKVGGKRASLADLTQKLLSIPGVVDGVVFQPESGRDEVVRRPAALVVAPSRTETEILAALGRLVDPVFVPRPLRKVPRLPRNDVGKLPKQALQKILADA